MDSPTVLCIDDRPQVLELRKATLESHGYSVEMASSSYTAITMLEQTSVAAVLLEYKREGMDAEAVAYQIKQRFPNLPIIKSPIIQSRRAEIVSRAHRLRDQLLMYGLQKERPEPVPVQDARWQPSPENCQLP